MSPPTRAHGGEDRLGVRDRTELAAFVDGVIGSSLRSAHVAGATVAIVKDGSVFYARGYGYSDVERRRAVDPERTLFRISSMTKLFTATAVMQLVEAGKLDLDTDVNRYLDFEIPSTYPEPITLEHILTHTAGFEDDGRDLWAKDAHQLVPAGKWLSEHMPRRVRPVGTYASYSNHATALAAYIVARVSGVPWEEYIERHILEPLAMAHTTVRQSATERFVEDMSRGYEFSGGTFESKDWEFMTSGGALAAGMSASATDMAMFMLAHLGKGSVAGRRILGEAAAATMHARAFGHDMQLPGMALGFYERSSHGVRIIGHGGDTRWFHSDLALIPSENLGVFVAFNTNTAGALSAGAFMQTFLDHYYPVAPAPAMRAADGAGQARQIAGEYQFNRMSYTTFQRAVGLAGASAIFTANPDGSLYVRSVVGDGRLVPVGPWHYRQELGTELFAFKRDESGRVTHGFVGSLPTMALERKPWHRSVLLHWLVIAVALVTFAVTLVAAGARAGRRWFGTPRIEDRLPGRRVLVALAATHVIFVMLLAVLMSDVVAMLAGAMTQLKIVLAVPTMGAVLTVAAAVTAVRQWTNGFGTRAVRLRYTVVVVIAILFLWSLSEWNLLFWNL